jgi:phosphoserine phosphatase
MSILNHPAISAFLQEHQNHAQGTPPIALFDCDGTVIRGDIGEAMFYHQIERFLFRRSPAEVWTGHPHRDVLDATYQTLARAQRSDRNTLPEFQSFAEILLSWYFDRIEAGQVIEACADIVRLFAGFTLSEVRAIADATFAGELAAPPGERRLGKRVLPRGIRFIGEATELLGELQKLRFEIWAISGSNRWSVEPVFRKLGISADHVVGIELAIRNGILTDTALEPIPIREGKIRSIALHTPRRPVLTASDSKNDIPLFLYSSGLKVRINSRGRDTADFFHTAKVSPDASWVLIESPTILNENP